jgi:hypothetical protein
MPIVIGEERNGAVMFQQLIEKILFEFKDSAFIGHGMCMGYRAFIAGFGYQNASIVRIERATEYIEQEIAFSHKTDTECGVVFGF